MKSPRQMGKGEQRAHQAKLYQLESNLSYLALWIEQETVKTARETSSGKSERKHTIASLVGDSTWKLTSTCA